MIKGLPCLQLSFNIFQTVKFGKNLYTGVIVSKKHIQFRLPPEVMSGISLRAKAFGISENEYVRNQFLKAWFGDEQAKMDKNVVKMICRSLCITQRLVGEAIEDGEVILKRALEDEKIILQKIGYGD